MKKLSIITINYNNCLGLSKTLESVINQTITDFEWIVIDGGSSDGSRELIEGNKQHMTFWCSEPDTGIFNAMNKGVGKASGEYCLFLNSGDRLHSNTVIEDVLPLLCGEDFICGDECVVDSLYNKIRIRKNPDVFEKFHLLVGCLWHQSTFIRTSLLKERPYEETISIVGDWETTFYQLVINNKTYKHIPVLISDFVIGGVSTDLKSAGEESRRIIDKYLTHREQDLIALAHFYHGQSADDRRQIAETAYTAFANGYYSQQEYIDIFAPYRKVLIGNSTFYHRFFNLMCLTGNMNIAKFIYKCVSRNNKR